MRRAATLAATLMGIAAATPASAEAGGPDFFRVIGVKPGNVLNIRSGPSAADNVSGTIPADGNGIRNLGCQGGLSLQEFEKATDAEREAGRRTRWCKVEYRGVTGWAAGWHLGEGGG